MEKKDFLVRNKNREGLAAAPVLWDSASDSPERSKLQRDQGQQQSMSSESLLPACHLGLLGRKAKAFRAV